jgi:cytochrome P450
LNVDAHAAARDVPDGPRGLPLLGSLLAFRKDPLGFVARAAREHGDAMRFTMAGRTVVLIVDPELIKELLVTRQHDFVKGRGLEWAKRYLGEGLLTSEGELHTRQRRLAQPAFHARRLAGYARVMTEHALQRRERWRDGQTLDLHAELMALTLAIAGRTLFDADVRGEAGEIGASLATIIGLFPRFSLPFGALLEKLPLRSNREFARARERLDATVYRIIAERRRDGRDHGDLLSMLMAARDEEDGSGMTDTQLRDEVITLFLAGHETTANMLAWTFHCLAHNQAAERRLHAELDAALGGRAPELEDVPSLGFVERVLAESMRLYPPAWILGRRALRETELGGYRIPKHAYVIASPYATQRDARFFPDPERFDADRFTPEAKAARHKFAYFPFGGGARQCIGEGFAWMEGTLLLPVLAQRFRLRPAPDARVLPQPLITLRPRYGMKMRLEARA